MITPTLEMYRHIFMKSPIGKAIADADGQLVMVNRAFAKLVGRDIEELQTLRFRDITYPDDVDISLRLFEELRRGDREEYSIDKRYLNKAGQIVPIALHVSVARDPDGVEDVYIAQIVDRSAEVRLLEKLNHRNEHLLNVNRIMAHDLRGPLSNQSMLLELLQEKNGVMEEAEILSLFQETNLAMLQQINDLLHVANLSDPDVLKPQPCVLETVLQTVFRRIIGPANDTAPQIATQFEVPEISYPKALLESVMYNFLSNSVKYAKPGSPASIEVKSYKIEDYIALSFADDGIGINLNDGKFRLFGLNEVGSREGYKSMGIGLYTVKAQVERFGGRITVESEPGKGAKFTLLIKDAVSEKTSA